MKMNLVKLSFPTSSKMLLLLQLKNEYCCVNVEGM